MMKKLTCWISAFLLILSFNAVAQPGKGMRKPGQMQQQPPPGMQRFAQLGLSQEQKDRMKILQEAFRNQMRELNGRENITVKEQRDQRNQLMKNHRRKMEEVLTPEQKKMLADRKASNQKIAGLRKDIAFERMSTRLGLTGGQAASIKAAREKMEQQLRAVRENDRLDRTAKKAAIAKAMKENRAEVEKTLTKDQLKTWNDMQQQRRKGMMDRRRQGPGRKPGGPGGPGRPGGPSNPV